jgi:hypothetical protein
MTERKTTAKAKAQTKEIQEQIPSGMTTKKRLLLSMG